MTNKQDNIEAIRAALKIAIADSSASGLTRTWCSEALTNLDLLTESLKPIGPSDEKIKSIALLKYPHQEDWGEESFTSMLRTEWEDAITYARDCGHLAEHALSDDEIKRISEEKFPDSPAQPARKGNTHKKLGFRQGMRHYRDLIVPPAEPQKWKVIDSSGNSECMKCSVVNQDMSTQLHYSDYRVAKNVCDALNSVIVK